MRINVHSDYGLRVLMYLAAQKGKRANIDEIAAAYGISKNHLMKVVHALAKHGFIKTVRGRGGGMCLATLPDKIKVGDILRAMENDLALVECMGDNNQCRIAKVCRLKRAFQKALQAYLRELDQWSIADLVAEPRVLLTALGDAPAT